jgi:Probable lipoprotein LpqN
MVQNAKAWLAVISGSAACIAGVICLASPNAVAEPMPTPVPTPVTVTQTVTIAPSAGTPLVAPQAASAPIVSAPTAALVPQAGITPATPTITSPFTPTLAPAKSGTLTDYLKSKNVALEPQRAQGFQAFNVTLPMPAGWTQVPDPNVPDAFAVIANRGSADLYTPNAQVIVYKLVGDFDPKEAITHGFIDSQSLAAWQSTDASLSDFCGFPSSVIEGTYRQNDMTLNTSRRHVIVTAGPDKYLVSLSVTSQARSQGASSAADATNAIVNGFRVAPGIPQTAAPPPPPAPPAMLPAQTG